MSLNQQPGGGPVVAAQNPGSTANIIYILYLASLVVGITALVGVVMAYVNRGREPEWVDWHYRFQIRTFWIGLLYAFAVVLLAAATFGLGGFLMLAVAVWWIVRCVKGMKWVSERRGPADPASWLFG